MSHDNARRSSIGRIEAATVLSELAGMQITKTWLSVGSTIFLELGKLCETSLPSGNRMESGEATIFIEWDWRVERPRSIEFGSTSSERRLKSGIQRLVGRRVREITVDGRLPELTIALSGDRWLRSFMTDASQPMWHVFLKDRSCLFVERGRLRRETYHEGVSAVP